ncbi:MAG: LacI family transcriptional regulator, partial [Sphingobacteriales bacterium]
LINHRRKPTAVVTFNDYVALFAIRHARTLGLNGIDFVSYANLPIIKYMDYSPIASVEQFPHKQGKKAADILIDLINRPKGESENDQAYFNVVVASELIVSTVK